MSFRLNPFKVMRAIGIVAIFVYAIVLIIGYKNSKVTTTDSITKDMKIRKKDFYNSKEYKNNLTLPTQVIENNNETVAKEIENTKPAQSIDLPKDDNKNQVKVDENAAEKKKKEEQKKLEAQKLEQAKIAEQKRQEEAKKQERKQAEEKAKAEAKKKEAQTPKGPRKYIQVASVGSESSAKEITKKLGKNFYYKKTTVNGRTAYVVMSNMTDNPNTLKAMENQAKAKAGGGYMIRSVGK